MKNFFLFLSFIFFINPVYSAQYVAGYPKVIKVPNCTPIQYICIGKAQGTQTKLFSCLGKNKICPSADDCLLSSRDNPELTKEETSLEFRLHAYAGLCSLPQINSLLGYDSKTPDANLNVNTISEDFGYTMVMSTIAGMRRKMSLGNCVQEDLAACLNSVNAFMKHPSYNWRNPSEIEETDIIFHLKTSNQVPLKGVCRNYDNMVLQSLIRNSQNLDFNFLSTNPAPSWLSRTPSALLACAKGGSVENFCTYFAMANMSKGKNEKGRLNLNLRIDKKNDLTPLLAAIEFGNPEMIKYLIGEGADVFETINGKNAVQFALARNRQDMAKVINDTLNTPNRPKCRNYAPPYKQK